MKKKKLAIVLSGGGSRGAYQMGVWKALKELNIKYDIVTGTSIGAINGMLMVQKDYNKCLKAWESVSLKYIYEEQNIDDLESIEIYKKYFFSFLNEGGVDSEKIKYVVKKMFNPLKFYFSNIDFGIVTYNITEKRPVFVKKKEVTKKQLIDFIVASSTCFPAFKSKKIEDDMYIDGGYYDNLPINLAIDMGATEVIAVDLKAPGFKKKIKNNDVKITIIKPKNKICSFLIFNSEDSKCTIKYGYNDAMKVFGKLEGNRYTFKNGNLSKNYKNNQEIFRYKLKEILHRNHKNILEKIISNKLFSRCLSDDEKVVYECMNEIIEDLGKIFKLDDSEIYDINTYNKLLIEAVEKDINKKDLEIENNIKLKISNIANSKELIEFMYRKISNGNISMSVVNLFPKDFIKAVYLWTIKENL
ncbi:MAG TPA: patatin-like phospholipase family protein [Tenericutes bacterium]|nr:patatin-like phospholipase family protein [Mycoplasmatota bacterium]